ncbi:glycoside hydrolase family 127 protein [Actinoplanes aureus]|uniref:Glycoside hydrolase family 127 protein n=1 Tax=Actinoplanes aureus TaxID=2792083 RepID=A0A931G0L2_9ACTN|nr:beta-L-arabinofuranosidase domain-containing protein [Actinoplanes aureus]MBG0564181.1 glycoside hydrolase family 127 protein [Actinoplanes aureus]
MPQRRTLLKAAAGAALLPPVTLARPDNGVSAYAFPLTAVRLGAGPFADNAARTQTYLRFLNADRLLHMFRVTAGLSSSATPCGGWESPTTELRGHSIGHVLTALAQAYASTGDTAYRTKGDYLVAQLALCQRPNGFLSAYPESFIDRVETGQQVWAPYYTLHKIVQGLLDMHQLAGNGQALTVLERKAAWVQARNSRLTYAQRQQMLRVEFGGIGETLFNLYQLSENPAHLTTAQYFDHAQVLDPLAANTDALAGFHANTQIPKALAAIRGFHATGAVRYRDIAVNFWNFVVRQHSYAIGGNSNGEYFQAPNRIASELSDTTCECCNSYNMLKLTRQLFFTDPGRGAELMDFYEKALYNHLLGAQNPGSAHGHHCYYVPLRPGGIKTYSNDYDNFTCCHGTGMETNTKYVDSVFFHNANTLWVNLFIAATLTWPGRGITVRQDTTFPETATSRLTVTGTGPIDLRVRIPSWATGAQVRVNGTLTGSPAPGTYLAINRTWASGDTVDISLPMALTVEPTPDNPAVRAVKHGPIVLAGQFGSTNLSALPSLDPATLRPAAAPLEYTAGSVLLRPFYKTHGQRYSVYWNVVSNTPREAHYPFEEASGSAVVDATGNGWNGTLAGAASRTAGRTGRGVLLGGGNAYIGLPAGILAGAASFTVAAWVRVDTAASWARVFDFGSGTGSYLFLTPRSSAGTARYAISTGGSGAEQRIDAPAALPTGTWTHVAVTHTGNLGVLYVNGAEVARNSALTVRPSALGATTQNWIGRSQYANDPYLAAAVDNVRIYSRALSAAEVSQLNATGQ